MLESAFARVAELEKYVQHLRAENERLKRFLEVGKFLGSERDIDKLLPLVMTETSKSLDADRSTLFLIDPERMELWTKFAEGLEKDRIIIDLKMGIAGRCAITGKGITVGDAYEDPCFNRTFDVSTGYRTQSVLCTPVMDEDGGVLGVIELVNKKAGVFTRQDESRSEEAAGFVSAVNAAGGLSRNAIEPTLKELRESTECDRSSFFVLDRVQRELVGMVAEGVVDREIRLSLRIGIAGYVAVTGEGVNIQDVYTDPRFDRSSDKRTGYRTRCVMCVPIMNHAGETLGVIQVINKKEGVFTSEDLELLKALAPQIAIAVENAVLFREQTDQFQSLLEVLAASIDAKDPLTAGHSQTVAEYAVGIARELGFAETEMDVLYVAALLHDYGKIGIDDNVLKKPGSLTNEEYEHIKQHITCTRNILGRMHFIRKYRSVPLIAACHHERLDGSGYMEGMKGHQIPYMSKVLAVADVFEALTARRHYREALPAEEAFRIMDEKVGVHFDSNILGALKSYWKKLH